MLVSYLNVVLCEYCAVMDPPNIIVRSLAEFERVRCNNCKGYLNHPPVVMFLEKGSGYIECGRCFNEAAAKSEGLTPVRNHILEGLAKRTPFPCVYSKNGCTERRLWPQIDIHEKECLLRYFNCPVALLEPCQYKGPMNKFLEHFEEEHPELLINDGIFKTDFNMDFENCYLINQNVKIFFFQMKFDVAAQKIWFNASLLEGEPLDCSIEFGAESSKNLFTIQHIATSQCITQLDTNKAIEIGLDAVRAVLKPAKNFKCKVCLIPTFPAAHSAEILKELQCTACWDFLRCKIFICENGHNICSKCKDYVNHCLTCRTDLLDVRNLSFEKLVRYSFLPCKNHFAGCAYIGTLKELICHLNVCSFNPNV